MNIGENQPDLYDANLAGMLLQTAVDEFQAMPFHMKLHSRIDEVISSCERTYELATGTRSRWENDTDRETRQRVRYGNYAFP